MIIPRAGHAHLAQAFTYQKHTLLRPHSLRSKAQQVARNVTRRSQTTYAQPPPQASLPSRILRTTLLYTTLSGTAFLTGAYLALTYLPNRDALLALFTAVPPSDAETLSLYTPPDAATSAINDHLVKSTLAQSLRAAGNFTEARPHMKIPEALKPTNLTGGTLAGPGRISVPPLLFADGGKNLTVLMHLGPQLCGHPGIIHGGLLATLLDEGLARCCFPALPGRVGVTANLNVDYRKPVRADKYYVLKAETTKVEGRKAWVRGWIEEMEGDGTRLCEAEGLFVSPRNAEMLGKVYRGAAAT